MIDFSNVTGSLFARLGKVGAVVANLGNYQAQQQTAMADPTSGVVGQLDAEPDVQAIVGGGYIGALDSTAGSVGSFMQTIAAAIVNRVVYRDNPRVDQTLTSDSTLASLQEIARQMKVAGASFRAIPVTVTPLAFMGRGNGAVNISAVRPFDGRTLSNAYTETINVTCVADSYTGGATVGQETIRYTGAGNRDDVFGFDWPEGSGAEITANAIDGSQDASGGNLLTNSGFDTWEDDAPVNWELTTGVAGVNVIEDTGVLYGGTACLKIVGDAAGTLTSIRQLFGDDSGTPVTLSPLTQYSFCCWMQRDGIISSQGVIRFSLTDAAGNVIVDEAGTPNSFTQDLSELPTLYIPLRGAFRTPLILPAAIYLRIDLTEALDDGRAVFLDLAGMGDMTQLYVGGPFLATHSGGAPFAMNDVAQASVVNGRGAGNTLNTWQTLMFRLFTDQIGQSELLFPESSSPSVQDAWIA